MNKATDGRRRGLLADDAIASSLSTRGVIAAVALLTLIAAFLRLAWLDRSPPGLNQDEAINAWNAWSLLKTGKDMVGIRWPVFYFHSIADNRTPLFIYWLVPFQALLGLSVVAMRTAPAVSGVLCVPLAYWTGSRLFGRLEGLIAAAMIVANPWHFSSTRWAIDGSIVPFLSLLTVSAMLWARLPIADFDDRPHPIRGALAGAVAGICCYGYWAIRLHFPVFLALAVLFTWRGWRDLARSRAGITVILAFALGIFATFGPLVLEHLRDPAIAVRGSMTRLWEPGTPWPEIARRVAVRYAIHFGPRFLFESGDQDPGNAPADSGAFEWAMLPLMLLGLAVAARRRSKALSPNFLLAMIVAYPVGDLAGRYPGVHAFRSAPGMVGLVLLAAVGLAAVIRHLNVRRRALAVATLVVVVAATILQDARSLSTYFGEWRQRPAIYTLFHTDFMEACEWVRPRWPSRDAVFWTALGVNMPFAMTLVALNYDPSAWASDPKDVRQNADGWDFYVRYGKNYFLYDQLCRPYVERMQAGNRPIRALFIVRPHELGLENPVHVIRGPHGEERLWICEGVISGSEGDGAKGQ